jgi:catechol 2,3-dioxygenase-like lactoylglutathione lyase family enzyme
MIRGIHHTSISTQDLDRLVAFYRDTIGLELIASYGWDRSSSDAENLDKIVGLKGSTTRSALFRAGNTHLEIFQYLTPDGKGRSPIARHVTPD